MKSLPSIKGDIKTDLKKILPESGWDKGMSRLTLTYKDREEESLFIADYTDRSLILLRFSMLFGAGQYLLFAVIDSIVAAGYEVHLLAIRLAVVAWISFVFACSFRASFKTRFQPMTASVAVVAGLGVAVMIMLLQTPGGYNDFYVGFMLVLFYTHALLRLRFIWATLTGWILFLIYIGATSVVGISTIALWNNTFYLVSTQCCGMVSSYALEFYARTVYRQNRDLELKRIELQNEHNRKDRELNDVKSIQLSMLPKEKPDLRGYEVAAIMKTATEIGGDFYDFLHRDECLTFAIGDATGHGARAGALVTAAKVLFVSQAPETRPDYFLSRASKVLRQIGLNQLYMSMAVGEISGSRLTLSGAGMPPALLYRAETGTVKMISLRGMPLGSPADYNYETSTTELHSGDILFLLSDGLPELFNPDGEMLGYEKPGELLIRYAGLCPGAILTELEREIFEFSNGEALRDDITLMVIKRSETSNVKCDTAKGRSEKAASHLSPDGQLSERTMRPIDI